MRNNKINFLFILFFFSLYFLPLHAFVVQVLTMDNQSYQGDLVQITVRNELSLVLLDSKTKKKTSFPCKEIVQVLCQKSSKEIPTPSIIFLQDGSKICGEIVNGGESEIEVASPSLGNFTCAIEKIREIQFKSNSNPLISNDSSTKEIDTSKDTLFFVGGDSMKGVIESIHKGYLEFQHSRLGLRREYFEKIERIIFAEIEPFSKPSHSFLQATIIGCDQSEISGKIIRLQEETLQLETPARKKIFIPLQNIQHFFFHGGQFVYISDLPPERYSIQYTHCFPNYANTYTTKLNRNFDGDRMVIAGQAFFKGIGVLPRTEIAIQLNGEFQKFQTHIGIDDKVLQEVQSGQNILGGTAIFQVWLDGEQKFDSGIKQYSDIQQIDISVKGGKKLILLVDYGKIPLGRNLANWGGARLIK